MILNSYSESISVESEVIDSLRDKIAAIAALERKYKTNFAGLESILTEYSEEFSLISDSNFLDELLKEIEKHEVKLRKLATNLSNERKKAARKLEKQVAEDFKKLNMKKASLLVDFQSSEIGPSGFEKISFKFLSHSSQAAKSLSEAASGGELSRIMLALKKAIKDKTGVNVLVFDEVDVGVSGGVARAVGEMLMELSESSQVVCITHLPQVASLADTHYLVSKNEEKQPLSSVVALADEIRIEEIARMLAGYTITPAARESARELLSSKIQ